MKLKVYKILKVLIFFYALKKLKNFFFATTLANKIFKKAKLSR